MASTEPLKIRPRERRGDRTRARLIEAALAEFRDHGFERASIARIAKAAGVSRPTFYFHFPKKEDLLREFLTSYEEALADRVVRAAEVRAALEELIGGVLEIQEQVGGDVFAEMLRAQTRAVSEEEERSTLVLDAITPLFRKSAEAGELRPGLDPERAAAVCMASMFGCLLDPERAGRPDDLRALASLFFRDSGGNRGDRDWSRGAPS
jgi:TetR/AcrR family transcriptional regulator of autoinduction and epiphytic fitness